MQKIKFVFFSILICVNAFGQSQRFLYKISGNGLSKPSYLLGTFHLLCKSDSLINNNIVQCIEKSDQVYLEIDMDDPKLPLEMMKLMKMDDGKKLKDLYSDADYAQISSYLKDSVGIPVFIFDQTKPLLLYSLIINKMIGCDMEVPENVIMSIAKKDGKQIGGLETIESQMLVFDNVGYKEQAGYLLEKVRNKRASVEEYETMRKDYFSGDLDKLMLSFEKEEDLTYRFKEDFLEKRNKNWIPVMEKNMQNHSTFFAVGAGHLGGESGVLQLLGNKGYLIEKL